MKKRKFAFGDIFSIIFSIFADLFFIGATIGCFSVFIQNPSIFTLIGSIFAAIIPGLITYGITVALVEFIRGK